MKSKKRLVLKALTDPKFRKLLQESPEEALKTEELAGIKAGADVVNDILNTVNQINQQAQKISDYIFCVIDDDPDGPILA
jgi:hypothetical protein